MKLSILRRFGFTLIELLVVISIIAILASLALPAITGALVRGQMTQSLSNMKQLHLATTQMALDASTTGDDSLGWPGDTGGTWAAWATNIVGGQYMSANDFAKMISAAGVTVSPGDTFQPDDPGTSAVRLYTTRERDPGTTVFLTSANYTWNTADLDSTPFQGRGFIVFRKGGDGTVYLPRQTQQTNLLGDLPTGVTVVSDDPSATAGDD